MMKTEASIALNNPKQIHVRMQVNDAVFDETGPIDEVNAKMRKFLDEHLHKLTTVIRAAKEALNK